MNSIMNRNVPIIDLSVLISHFDRIQASEGWHDASVMIKKEDEKKLRRIIPVRAENFVCPLQAEYIEEKFGAEFGAVNPLSIYTFFKLLQKAELIQFKVGK